MESECTVTVDLDPGEKNWLERVIGIHERILQSGFVQDQQSIDDLEMMDSVIREIIDEKRRGGPCPSRHKR